jgi:hypothetical protein
MCFKLFVLSAVLWLSCRHRSSQGLTILADRRQIFRVDALFWGAEQ